MNKPKRRKYTEEFRQDAVKLVSEQGYKASEAARNLGIINEGMLRRWIQKYSSDESITPEQQGALSAEQKRIRELQKQVKQLEMEREILKKATAFFVKESI
ncbi:MAG: transposase [Pseudomonadales bacterium]